MSQAEFFDTSTHGVLTEHKSITEGVERDNRNRKETVGGTKRRPELIISVSS